MIYFILNTIIGDTSNASLTQFMWLQFMTHHSSFNRAAAKCLFGILLIIDIIFWLICLGLICSNQIS